MGRPQALGSPAICPTPPIRPGADTGSMLRSRAPSIDTNPPFRVIATVTGATQAVSGGGRTGITWAVPAVKGSTHTVCGTKGARHG